MDKFTAFDIAVLGVMLVLLISLNGAWFIVNKIKKLVKQAELENNELKFEIAKLRKQVDDLTPKPQGQSLVQTSPGLSDLEYRHRKNLINGVPENVSPQGRHMFEGIPPAAHQRNVFEHMHHNRPAQPVNSNVKPSTPWPRTSSVPSSSRVRDVHHHHHNTNDNFVTGVMVGSMLSSDDTPSRSAPVCAPSRDSDYSPPSDSGDSGSPSCD